MDQNKVIEEVKEKFRCQHDQTAIRVRTDKSGRKLIARQCIRCGLKQGDYLSPKQFSDIQLQEMSQWNVDLERDFSKQRSFELVARVKDIDQQERDAFLKRHRAFLKSDIWHRLRSKVLKRANYICEGCGDAQATEVHHLNYTRWGGNELLIDLLAVCGDCHLKLHPKKADPVDILLGSRNIPDNNRGVFDTMDI